MDYIFEGLRFYRPYSSPETYEVFDSHGVDIGYVCIRDGQLYLECPYDGDRIYECNIGDDHAESFESEEQREYHLKQIAKAVNLYYGIETGEPCSICQETIKDVSIHTIESGWYIPVDFEARFCPYCGRKLKGE